MMSDESTGEERKDETQSQSTSSVPDDMTHTSTSEVSNVQGAETDADRINPGPGSETSSLKKDKPIDDVQNKSDSTAILPQETGNGSSVFADESGLKNTKSGITPDLTETQTDSNKSETFNVDTLPNEVSQDVCINPVTTKAVSLNEVPEQGTIESSLEVVGKDSMEATETENSTQNEEVNKVKSVGESYFGSGANLALDCGENPSESVDSLASFSNKDSNSDQPSNLENKIEKNSAETNESRPIVQKTDKKLTDSVDISVEEQSPQEVEKSSSLQTSKETLETSEQPKKEAVVCEQNVEPVSDTQRTKTESICKISDISSKSNPTQAISDAKQTCNADETSEVKNTSEKKKTPGPLQVISDVKQITSDPKETISEAKQITPEVEQIIPEAKQVTPIAKQITPETKQVMPEAKQITPEVKQITPEAKQITPEVKQITPEAKQTSDPKRSTLDAKAITDGKQTTETKAAISDVKKAIFAEETKNVFDYKKLDVEDAESNDSSSASGETADISSNSRKVLESVNGETAGSGSSKPIHASPEKATELNESPVNPQVSVSCIQKLKSGNSSVNQVDIDDNADECKTENSKPIEDSFVDSPVKASESNSPSLVKEPLISETVQNSSEISVDESINCPEKEKSKLNGADCKDTVLVHSSSDDVIPSDNENSQNSSSVDESVCDLPTKTDSLEIKSKKEAKVENKSNQAIVEDVVEQKSAEEVGRVPEDVTSIKSQAIPPSSIEDCTETVEKQAAKKEAECGSEDSQLKESSADITENSVLPQVAAELKLEKSSVKTGTVDGKKTDLESAIEAVKEEAELINSMKQSTNKSSDTKEVKEVCKTIEEEGRSEKEMLKDDEAPDQTEKVESTTVVSNAPVEEKKNVTVSAVETKSKSETSTDVSCNTKALPAEFKLKESKELSEAGSKVPPPSDKPKTTKVMPSLREIRKVPVKSVAGTVGEKSVSVKGAMSLSIVKKPKLSETDLGSVKITKQVTETKFGQVSISTSKKVEPQADSGQKTPSTLQDSKQVSIKKVENNQPVTVASSNSAKSIVKPRNSTENDPLLNITSECRVELEITKIPANCQLKTEPGGKPVFVLKKDSPGLSPQESPEKRQKQSLLKSVLNSGQTSKTLTPGRPSNRTSGMVKASSDDSVVVNRPVGRPGRKRAITIDMTRPSGLQPPAVKVVKMDPNQKSRTNLQQMQRTFPGTQKSGPSSKTTSALEMLLMNRGVTPTSSISDASVANFCQVEQLVTEPDMFSTPINQLKKLSKGPADSILKQIAFGSQQFGAITISPVNSSPAPSPKVTRPVPPGVPFKQGPRPAPIVRKSSVDNVIEGVVAGQGVISDKCLLELNSAGEPKKKRGRPRKIIPGVSPQPNQGETVQCAPDLFFVPHESPSPQPVIRTPAPKPVPLPVSTPVTAEVSSPATPSTPSATPVSVSAESGPETPQSEEEDENGEPKKSASGRSVRTCTIKEPKKKDKNATPNSGTKTPRSGKKNKNDEPAEPDPEEEARKQKAIEDEVKRKAELKEKRQQERKEKMELRTKALAEKKAKLKRRAEERKRQYYEKKQRLQEEKAEIERQRALAPPETFSEETQMGDENESGDGLFRNKKGRMEVIDPESSKEFKVHQVAEYQWPLQGGEFFMLQEQISQYLGVKSFKRKYPDIQRRTIEAEERTFLCDSGLVSETMCDLGLTALRSADVLDIMFADFHDKYEEFRQHLRDMQAKEFSLKKLALAGKPSGDQLDSIERAVHSAARWNSALNKSRKESRRCCLDLQTFVIQYPRSRLPKATQEIPKIGNYPISLIPGQFTDYYKPYSAAELRYLPVNTVLYGPIKPYNVIVRETQNDFISESEDSSSSDGSSSSSSDSSDSEDSGDEVAMDIDVPGQEGAICKICNGNKNKNKRNKPEVLIHCAQCTGSCHPSCLDLSLEMVPHIQRYEWQCTDCKKCIKCKEVSDEDKMLFCDLCDRGYHFYCVGLKKVPVGRWHCQECAICAACSCHEPGPSEASSWHHEFKRGGKGGKNTYLRSFCENCAKDQTPAEGNILKRES